MPSILIVDDEEDIRELISVNLLREQNYTITEAVDGLEALDKARSDRPDLIILDLMLPEMDGLTVFKNIREDVRRQNIPIIMLTALGRLEEKLEGLEIGADDYLDIHALEDPALEQIKGFIDVHYGRSKRRVNPKQMSRPPTI